MFTLLTPWVSSSTTAIRWVPPPLVAAHPASPRLRAARTRGAKRRIDEARTCNSGRAERDQRIVRRTQGSGFFRVARFASDTPSIGREREHSLPTDAQSVTQIP